MATMRVFPEILERVEPIIVEIIIRDTFESLMMEITVHAGIITFDIYWNHINYSMMRKWMDTNIQIYLI